MFPVTITLHDAAQLTAVMHALSAPTTTAAKVESPKPPKAEARAATQPAPAVEKAVPTVTAAESPSDPKPQDSSGSSPKPTASVDYPTLQKAVFALAGKSREAAGAVAQSFGVKTFKELPEAKWADALAAVSDKLAELEAA